MIVDRANNAARRSFALLSAIEGEPGDVPKRQRHSVVEKRLRGDERRMSFSNVLRCRGQPLLGRHSMDAFRSEPRLFGRRLRAVTGITTGSPHSVGLANGYRGHPDPNHRRDDDVPRNEPTTSGELHAPRMQRRRAKILDPNAGNGVPKHGQGWTVTDRQITSTDARARSTAAPPSSQVFVPAVAAGAETSAPQRTARPCGPLATIGLESIAASSC